MDLNACATIVFLFLLIVYGLQLTFISLKLRKPDAGQKPLLPSGQLWTLLVIALIAPTLIAFIPDLLSQGVELLLKRAAGAPAPLGEAHHAPSLVFVGVRFMIAYVATIVTLELTLQAQAIQANKKYVWQGMLLANLALDIISLIALQFYKPISEYVSDPMTTIFFVVSAVPTALAGGLVVSGASSELA